MPKNPYKTHCQIPGCRAWAMRGHTHCRAHRDAELGPRGAGAPPANLNALKHGGYSHPLSPPDLERLASAILRRPADLPVQIGLTVASLYARTTDPFMTLTALRRLLSQLTALVATRLLVSELQTFLHSLPPPLRGRTLPLIRQYVLDSTPAGCPEARLLILRKLVKTITGTKQLPETENNAKQPNSGS